MNPRALTSPALPSGRPLCCAAVHRPLLLPRMASLLDRIARANAPPFYAMSPVEARQAYMERSEVLELPRVPARAHR